MHSPRSSAGPKSCLRENATARERSSSSPAGRVRGSADTSSTDTPGCSATTLRADSMPSMSGIRTSMITRSGAHSRTRRTASAPEPASPAHMKPAVASTTRCAASRNGRWSSTASTRNGSAERSDAAMACEQHPTARPARPTCAPAEPGKRAPRRTRMPAPVGHLRIDIDVRMPPSGADEGIRVANRLRTTHARVGVLVLSQFAEPEYALALLEGGADRRAYLLKDRVHDRRNLARAVREVAAGGSAFDAKVVEALVAGRNGGTSPLRGISPREREVLAEVAQGKSNAAIAESLVLTKSAVEKHINSIFGKLGLAGAQDVSQRVKAALMFLDDTG